MNNRNATRINYGPHAIIVTPHPVGAPFRTDVWLHADRGNTRMNPDFRNISMGRHETFDEALNAGEAYLEQKGYVE